MKSVTTPISQEVIKGLSKTQLRTLAEGEQSLRVQLEDENAKLRELCDSLAEQRLEIEGKYVKLKNMLFAPSSEVQEKPKPSAGRPRRPNGRRQSRSKKPSDRYLNIPILDKELELEQKPNCSCCANTMQATNLNEVSEELTVTPKKYHITRYHRRKYRCSHCYGSMITTPAIPRMIPGSSYSDEMIIDVALSKFCDLIPIERYSAMAKRQGVDGLPPNSLINLTHHLALFLEVIYTSGLKQEILTADSLRGDESPHRMLEGDEKRNWFLWQFAATGTVYFECHDTRAAKVSSRILEECEAVVFLSDDYGGYGKSVREANTIRKDLEKPIIEHGLCNAHSRRKFAEAELNCEEATYFIQEYGKIYAIESRAKELPNEEKLQLRATTQTHFQNILRQAQITIESYSAKSLIAKATKYFISNYDQLTLFTRKANLSIDNNATERPFRSPAIGRKTWYGTHSKRGAKTLAIMFSIVESCKVNKVNPREYIPDMVSRLHAGKPWVTPRNYQQNTS